MLFTSNLNLRGSPKLYLEILLLRNIPKKELTLVISFIHSTNVSFALTYVLALSKAQGYSCEHGHHIHMWYLHLVVGGDRQ
jgi:hypothetical protein